MNVARVRRHVIAVRTVGHAGWNIARYGICLPPVKFDHFECQRFLCSLGQQEISDCSFTVISLNFITAFTQFLNCLWILFRHCSKPEFSTEEYICTTINIDVFPKFLNFSFLKSKREGEEDT
jgi:hypothetical protein